MVLSDRDRTLITGCIEGANSSWAEFVSSYLPLITHVVNMCIASKGSVASDSVRDDLVAEVMLAIVDNDFAVLKRFRGQSSLGTYLVVISRRVAMRALAKDAGVRVAVPLDNQVGNAADSPSLENKEEVQALLAKMPAEQAQAIRLFHLEHRSYGDIGSSLGIPENSVGPLLSRARQTMRSLEKH